MSRAHGLRLAAFALLACAGLRTSPASADNRYLEIPPPAEAAESRAVRYANLPNPDAFAELDRRGIRYEKVLGYVPGVRAPIRLRGPIRGVDIHSVLPEDERAETPFEILDARLAIALDDFCQILGRHDVVEIVHYTMYRPPMETPESLGHPQTRHPGGMAIDVGALRKRNGDWLSVGTSWSAAIGKKTCGLGARKLQSRRGREVMSIVCEAYDQKIFHYMLSPHFDRKHSDHLHLEIKPDVKWFLVN